MTDLDPAKAFIRELEDVAHPVSSTRIAQPQALLHCTRTSQHISLCHVTNLQSVYMSSNRLLTMLDNDCIDTGHVSVKLQRLIPWLPSHTV